MIGNQRGLIRDTLDAILEGVYRFRGALPISNDITIIGVEVT